jgi:hypothetical protein
MGTAKTRLVKQSFYWAIEGFDGDKKIYSETIKSTLISKPRMEQLLMALTARAGLSFKEIVAAYVIKRTNRHNTHLAVNRDSRYRTLTCGSNPHFVARLVGPC